MGANEKAGLVCVRRGKRSSVKKRKEKKETACPALVSSRVSNALRCELLRSLSREHIIPFRSRN